MRKWDALVCDQRGVCESGLTMGLGSYADRRYRTPIAADVTIGVSLETGALKPGERWYAVYTLPHRESGVVGQLNNQRFRNFFPLRPKTWRHAHTFETRLVPLFPGYVFVVLDLGRDRWRSVNGTYGVRRLVMSTDDRPVPVHEGFVEALIATADPSGCVRHEGTLRNGQSVRIVAGPFGDRIGELIRLDDAARIAVLIEFLGGRVPVVLSEQQVMPIL